MIGSSLSRLSQALPFVGSSRSQTDKDRALARELYFVFERDLEETELEGIHFYVQEQVVTLYGAVRHELDRRLLLHVVEGLDEVREVRSNLQVASGGTPQPAGFPQRPKATA